VALGHGQRPAGHEAVLTVDGAEDAIVTRLHACLRMHPAWRAREYRDGGGDSEEIATAQRGHGHPPRTARHPVPGNVAPPTRRTQAADVGRGGPARAAG